jgi:hypothetical protein
MRRTAVPAELEAASDAAIWDFALQAAAVIITKG